MSVWELALDGSVPAVNAKSGGQQEKVAKYYYDSNTKDLPELQVRQPVHVQHHVTKLWDVTGVIIKGNRRKRSYLVRVEKYKDVWHNRRFLQPMLGGSGQAVPRAWPLSTTPAPAKSTQGRMKREGVKKEVTFNPKVKEPPTSSWRSQPKTQKPD